MIVDPRKSAKLVIGLCVIACTIHGCACSQAEVCIKTAFQMYGARADTLGPPPAHLDNHVRHEIGRERFALWMERFADTKYQHEALYALGWYGDRRQAEVAARHLTDSDPTTRRIALAAFSQLVQQEFADGAAAKAWWRQQHGGAADSDASE